MALGLRNWTQGDSKATPPTFATPPPPASSHTQTQSTERVIWTLRDQWLNN